jgi:hypothetical protein
MTMKQIITAIALTLIGTGLLSAQETTGTIVGAITTPDRQPLPGVTVTAENPETGLARVVITSAEGRFRFSALPPAGYTISASLDGFQTQHAAVGAAVGQTTRHDVQMQLGAFADVIEVTGQPSLLDPVSTVAGLTVDTDELSSRIPVSRDVTRLSLLAPGTVPGDQSFESQGFTPGQSLVSFGGAAINENSYLVNGLNITSLSTMMGSSFVPMEFVDQAQIKTGGYQAEFGRSTGGVVNLVTKSGTNTLRASFSTYWSPKGLQEQEPDIYRRGSDGSVSVSGHNQSEERRSLEANASLGGPLLEDRLFFFAFLRWAEDEAMDIEDTRALRLENSAPYWGGKLDWQASPSHRLEGTYLSDRTDVNASQHAFDPLTRSLDELIGHSIRARGGGNAIFRYTGMLSDSVLFSAQAGRNEFEHSNRQENADACPLVGDYRSGSLEPMGCAIDVFTGRSGDERTAYRADVDWYLGRHALRAGADLETNRTVKSESFTGGIAYRYWLNGAEGELPETYRYAHLPWHQELVFIREYFSDGAYDALSNAVYVQDSWAVAPSLTLNLGARWERFDNENAEGESFLEISDQIAPRLGAAWDPSGDGRAKVYGSFGVYHLPMSTSASELIGGRYYWATGWYLLEGGINPDGSPESLGEELDFNLWHPWGVDDPRGTIDSSLEPMSQRELVLGYERMLRDNWSVGLRGVAREFEQVIEDVDLDRALYEAYGVEDCVLYGYCGWYVLTNPGTDFSGWYDLDWDGTLDPISLTAEQLRFPEAERKYRAVELSADRRFADGWMLHGSYTWSHGYGNYEGLVNSDVNQVNPYFTETFDVAALLEHASGDLPNDRRHNLKVYGMYAWPGGLQAGGFLSYRSGRPVSGRGMHPTDLWARAYGNRAFYNAGEPCPRGCVGTTEASWGLDLTMRYDLRALGADWKLRLDAFNVFDNDTVTEVDERAELSNFQTNPSYLMARHHQSPRSVRLGFGVSF